VDFLSLFSALERANARYVLVGGLAVVLHGIDRITADVDLAIDLSTPNADAVLGALAGEGMKPMLPVNPRQFSDPKTRDIWHRDRGMEVFSFWDRGAAADPAGLRVLTSVRPDAGEGTRRRARYPKGRAT
jgi:hypothetical protein